MPHESERTCVGCRRKGPKRDLIRIVATPGGVWSDPGGSLPGRGAYVHRSADCAHAALGRGALARALRASMSADEASNLLREIEREALEKGVIENR